MTSSRLPRIIGVTVAITAPLTAAATLAIGRRRRPPRGTVTMVAEYGIANVPRTPPLWQDHGTAEPRGHRGPARVSPVPPENPHAPATPVAGMPRRSA